MKRPAKKPGNNTQMASLQRYNNESNQVTDLQIAGETIDFMIGKNKFCIGYNILDNSTRFTLHFYTPRTPRNCQQLCDLQCDFPDENLSLMRKNSLHLQNPPDFKYQNLNSSSQLAISFHPNAPTASRMVTLPALPNFGHFISQFPTEILMEILSKLRSVNVISILEHSLNNENYNFSITVAKTPRINAQIQDLNCSKWQLQIRPNTELIPMGKCIQTPKLPNREMKINFGWNAGQTTQIASVLNHGNTLPEFICVYDSLKTIRIEKYFEMPQFQTIQTNSKSTKPNFESTDEHKICNTTAFKNTEMKFTDKKHKMQLLPARTSEICHEEEKHIPHISKLDSPTRLEPAINPIFHVVEEKHDDQFDDDMDTDIQQRSYDDQSTTQETFDAIPNLILLPSSTIATPKFIQDQTVPIEILPGVDDFLHIETCLHDNSSEKDSNTKDNNLKPNFTWITPNEHDSDSDADEHTKFQTEMPQIQSRKIQWLGLRLGLSKRQRVAPLHPAYKKIKLGKAEE